MNIPGQIQYVFLLGKRDCPTLVNVPQDSICDPLFRLVGCLPQTMSHFIYGVEFYETMKRENLQLGYNVTFVYADATPEEINFLADSAILPNIGLKEEPMVLINCSRDFEITKYYISLFKEHFNERTLWVDFNLQENFSSYRINCAVAKNEDDIIAWLMSYALKYCHIDYSHAPFSVPLIYGTIADSGHYFTPTWVNTHILNTLMGNWLWKNELRDDEIIERQAQCSKDAFDDNNGHGTSRQDLLCDQIKKIRTVENTVLLNMLKDSRCRTFIDQLYSPLIISLPYTSKEMGITEDKRMSVDDKRKVKQINKILSAEYSLNYTVWNNLDGLSPEEILAFSKIQQEIVSKRMNFLDFVGMLHCSFKISPYMRLPIMGKNIAGDLSKVGLNSLNSLKNAYRKKGSVRKIMEQIGHILAVKSMAPNFQKLLQKIPNQIVAITDLPIEWSLIDSVPLCFTHDVCRLPETSPASILSQFVEAKNRPYVIPKDILSKTLVIFGNDEEAFENSRLPIVELQKHLGFKTRQCLSKKDFFDAILEETPELIIVDSHGGVDLKTNQSHIVIGTDIVTGEDVVKSGIAPRLVFLSACNTFTTYNTVSTIANAFFEVGAMAVTVSYMPILIQPATVLYARLLRNLEEAAIRNIHHNWLAFISHLLRTSFIMSPLEVLQSEKIDSTIIKNLGRLNTLSMDFRNRSQIYHQLHDKYSMDQIGVNYNMLLPHYLMYSTLGRADLVRFESAMEEINSFRGISGNIPQNRKPCK